MDVQESTGSVQNFFTSFIAGNSSDVLNLIHDDAELFHTKNKEDFRKLLNVGKSGLEVSKGLDLTSLRIFAGIDHIVAEINSTDYPFLRFCFIFEFQNDLIWKARDYNRNMESERPNPGKQAGIGSWPPMFWPPK